MNQTYRSIWNESLGAWVAASELTLAKGKPGRAGRSVTLADAGASRQRNAAALSAIGAAVIGLLLSLAVSQSVYAQTDLGGGTGAGVRHIAIGGSTANCTPVSDSSYTIRTGLTTANQGAISNGTESIAIGGNCSYPAAAVGTSAFALGVNAMALGNYSFSMGRDSIAAGALSQAWGYGANASGTNSIALGSASVVNNAQQGDGPKSLAADGIAIGRSSVVASTATASVAVGLGAKVSQANSVAIGATANGASSGKIAIGSGASVGEPR